jgi:hypothetical protein
MDNGNPDYFDIIGQKGMEQYQKLANKKGALVNIPDAIPIKHDYKVEIEIESGLGYTEEGKRNTMISILEWMMKLAQMGYVTNEAVGLVIQRFLEIFQFGSTAEFMDALEAGTPPLTENQIKEVKIAVMEVIKDLQNAQQPQAPMPSTGMEAPAQTAEDQDILKIKTGVMQAFSDLKNANQGGNNAIDQGGEQSAV